MIVVDTYASFRKSEAVAHALNSLCQQAEGSSYHGHHIQCNSNDAQKRAAMEPFPDYCVLHALTVRTQSGTFICPAGIDPATIISTADQADPKY